MDFLARKFKDLTKNETFYAVFKHCDVDKLICRSMQQCRVVKHTHKFHFCGASWKGNNRFFVATKLSLWSLSTALVWMEYSIITQNAWKNAFNEADQGTLFNDGQRKIDMVLAYEDPDDHEDPEDLNIDPDQHKSRPASHVGQQELAYR